MEDSLKVLFNIAYTTLNPPKFFSAEKKAAHFATRKFYDLTSDYNYFSYTQKEGKVINTDTSGEKNSGVFNDKKILGTDELDEIRQELRKTQSIIWHGFVSFDEETSKGLTTQEKAIHFLNQTFNAFLDDTHLSRKNIRLYASIHGDTNNKHIHFAFYEKEPKWRDKNGKLSYATKGNISQRAIDNYLVSANMHMDEHAYEYYTARDRALEKLRSLKGVNLKEKKNEDVKFMLLSLAKKLPQEGRLQYKSERVAAMRNEIDIMARALMRRNGEAWNIYVDFEKQMARKENEVKRLAEQNKIAYVQGARLTKDEITQLVKQGKTGAVRALSPNYGDGVKYIDDLRYDFRARLGNQVLGLIKTMNKDYLWKKKTPVNDLQRKIQARRKRSVQTRNIQLLVKFLDEASRKAHNEEERRLVEVEKEIERLYGRGA